MPSHRAALRGRGLLPETPWSLLGQAAKQDAAALDRLCRLYRPVLLLHIQLFHRWAPQEAEDLAQGFLQERVLRPGWLSRVDRQRGRFRALLLSSLGNYLRNCRRRPVPEPAKYERTSADESTAEEEDVFEVLWAQEVMRRTIERTRAACAAAGQHHFWALFEERMMRPVLELENAPSYADCLARLGFQSVQQSCNALVTVNRRLRRALREVVGEYTDPEEVDAEIRGLAELARRNDEILAAIRLQGGR